MDIMESFEYPLPYLHTNLDKIFIETSGNFEGSFVIKNSGGGELNGKILSNSKIIKFTPDIFTGKSSTIFYTLNLNYYKPNDVIQTSAVIMSNGGEKTIPVTIKVVSRALETKEGEKIIRLKDFFAYSQRYPVSSRQLFMSQEFMIWLYAIGFEHMDMYEHFSKDSNKERALDNFFILSGIKKKTKLSFQEQKINLVMDPFPDKQITGEFSVIRSVGGYAESKLLKRFNSSWLTLNKEKVTTSDFNENNTTKIDFYVNAKEVKANGVIEKIIFENESTQELSIVLRKRPVFEARLSKEVFSYEDTGEIILTNCSGAELYVDILPMDNYIKLEGRRYQISQLARIPFQIKISAFLSAQLSLKKQPVFQTEIDVRINSGELTFRKNLVLLICKL